MIYTKAERLAFNQGIKEARQDLKTLINEMIFNFEASESGTDDNILKAYYRAKICGLLDLLQKIQNLEDIESQIEHEKGADIGTETAREIKRQNGEE